MTTNTIAFPGGSITVDCEVTTTTRPKKLFAFDVYCHLSDAPAVDAMIRACATWRRWRILEADQTNMPRQVGQPEIVVELSYAAERDPSQDGQG